MLAGHSDNSLPPGTLFVGRNLVEISSECYNEPKGRWTLDKLEAQAEEIRSRLGFTKEAFPTEVVSGTEVC